MEYIVTFLGYENKILHKLIMRRYNGNIEIIIDNDIVSNLTVDEMQPLLKKYNSGNIDGINFKERELAKLILKKSYSDAIINLFQAFAVSDGYLIYTDIGLFNKSIFIKHITETFDRFCHHSSLIAWTGDLGPQPVMYFLKKEHNYSDDELNNLFSMGILQKIEVKIESVIMSNYYIPFEIPKYTNLQMLNVRIIWNKLLKDMSQELSKLNRGNDDVDN
jgi:hypothetical protein